MNSLLFRWRPESGYAISDNLLLQFLRKGFISPRVLLTLTTLSTSLVLQAGGIFPNHWGSGLEALHQRPKTADAGIQASSSLSTTTLSVILRNNGNTTLYGSIQDAHDHAADGDTIELAAGVYREQVTFTNAVTLLGAGKHLTILESPDSSLLINNGGWKNMRDNALYSIIGIRLNNTNEKVVVKDLTIDGRDQGFLPLPISEGSRELTYAFNGISAINSNLEVYNVKVTNVRELAARYSTNMSDPNNTVPAGYLPEDQPAGANNNHSIFAESAAGAGTHVLRVHGTYITKFHKTGILAWGPTLEVDIQNDTIQGYGQTLWSTSNGIQIASTNRSSMGGANGDRRGTRGVIKNNFILDMGVVIPNPGNPGSYFAPYMAGPTCILLYEAGDGIEISGNTITRTPYQSWHNDFLSNDGGFSNAGINIYNSRFTKVVNNTVSGFDAGIAETGALTGSHFVARGNTVSNNVHDYFTAQTEDSLFLSNDAETIGYYDQVSGNDYITGFGAGDRIHIIGFATGSVNGLLNGVPVINYTGGEVIYGDGTQTAPKTVEVKNFKGYTALYIDTDSVADAAEATIRLAGTYSPGNFKLNGGFIEYSHTVYLKHNGDSTGYANIQWAHDAAAVGDTIQLGAQTYVEQVTITKGITLQGADSNSTIIRSPLASELVNNGSWKTLRNDIVVAVIGVRTNNSQPVIIRNLKIDGNNQGTSPTYSIGAYSFMGIGSINTNLIVDQVAVVNVRSLATENPSTIVPSGYRADQPSGYNQNEAIFAEGKPGSGPYQVELRNSFIMSYQKTAMLLWGPTLSVNVENNTIQGYGKTLWSTGNAMQIASSDRSSMGGDNGDRRGTKAVIRNNRILDIGIVVPEPGDPNSYFNPYLGGSTGILFYMAGDSVQVLNNIITGCGILSWNNSATSNNGGWANAAVSTYNTPFARIEGNTFSKFDLGFYEGSASTGSYVLVKNNTVSDNGYDYFTASSNDSLLLTNDAEKIGYYTSSGSDLIIGFGEGDSIDVVRFVTNSVNNQVGGLPVTNFTGGSKTNGNGTSMDPTSIQMERNGGITTVYVNVDNTTNGADFNFRLAGDYYPSNFNLNGSIISYVRNTPPTISAMLNRHIECPESASFEEVAFNIADSQNLASELTVRILSSDTSLIKPSRVVFSGTDSNRVARIYAEDGQSGQVTVTLIVEDDATASDSSSFVVIIRDSIAPQAIARPVIAYLDVNGQVTVAASLADSASTDNCTIATRALNPSVFDCHHAGTTQQAWFVVSDASGNADSVLTDIEVVDTMKPMVVTRPVTLYLNASGAATLTTSMVDNGSLDACGIGSLSLSKTNFSCTDTGSNQVVLSATDINGNQNQMNAMITVRDTIRPQVAVQNLTVYLNNTGIVTITPSLVNNGSADNCGVQTLTLSKTSFSCTDAGLNQVILTVTDVNGNSDTASATVTVLDTIRPTALVKANGTVVLYMNASGSLPLLASQVDNGSGDNCGLRSTYTNPAVLTCSDIGIRTVTLIAEDEQGNIDSASTDIIVQDPILPVARPKSNVNIYLSANGQAVINPSMLDSASTDNCTITSRTLSQSVFTCANVGANTVVFTVTDQSGNSKAANTTVTILDTIRPIVTVQPRTIYLDQNGTAGITASAVNNNSSDNCGIGSMSLSKSNFTCADLGQNQVYLRVNDVNGNTDSGLVIITVLDTVKPWLYPQYLVNLYLNASGSATLAASQIDSASSDNCGSTLLSLSKTQFSCSDLGMQIISFSAVDPSGNTATTTARIMVLDTIKPVLTTRQDTIYLNSNGAAVLASNQLVGSASDNCQSVQFLVNQSNFSCIHLGVNVIQVTARDASGNEVVQPANLVVRDTIRPVMIGQNLTVYLNASGTASITAAQVNNGSTDNCAINTLSLSQTSFSGAHLGANLITLTGTDGSGNTASTNVTVTILDTIKPVVVTRNVTVSLDATGNGTLTAAQVNNGSTDNVSISTYQLSQTAFTCNDLGTKQVILSVTDGSLNTGTATAIITVVDNINPVAVAQNLTVYLNGIGVASVTAAQASNGSTDNCGISSLQLSKTNFSCSDVGNNTITLQAFDASGNMGTTNFTVTVQDTTKPNVVINNNLIVYLGTNGQATLSTTQVNNGSTDNCGINALNLSRSSFSGVDKGLNVLTFTVTDVNGNSNSAQVNVTVLDTIRPSASGRNLTVYLNAAGTATITPAQINNGSADNVGIASLVLSKSGFTCSDLGVNQVIFTVTDSSGNQNQQIVQITVLDTLKPQPIARNLTVYLNALGQATITESQINNGSADNCGIAYISLSKTSFSCAETGVNQIHLLVVDPSGNRDSVAVQITVLDTIRPNVFINNNLSVYLDINGKGTLTTTDVNNNSNDNCGVSSLTLSKTSFDGTNLGQNQVTFTVTDPSGNSSQVLVTLNVMDTVAPRVLTQNLTIYLDVSGNAVANANLVNNGSWDSVGIVNVNLSRSQFNCAHLGANQETLSVTDRSGNTGRASVQITVLDTIRPVLTQAPQDISIGYCAAAFTYPLPTATDNCGSIIVTQTAGLPSGSVFPVGNTTNTFVISDASGNSISTSFTITVRPGYLPVTFNDLTFCTGDTAYDLSQGATSLTFRGNGLLADRKTFVPGLAGAGTFVMEYTFRDSMQCDNSGTFLVTVYNTPEKPVIERMNANVIRTHRIYDRYQWYRNGVEIPGQTAREYTMKQSGYYQVVVFNNNGGCANGSDDYPVGVVSIDPDGELSQRFVVYPNPANRQVFVQMEGINPEQTTLVLFDALGKEVLRVNPDSEKVELPVAELVPGTYYIRLINGDVSAVKPVIIAR